MASLTLTADRLQISQRLPERIAGLHRDLTVPVSAIESVTVPPNGLAAVHGLRVGLGMPFVVYVGTWWRRDGRRSYVSVRRGVPTLQLTLRGSFYDEVLVSNPRAEQLAERIRRLIAAR